MDPSKFLRRFQSSPESVARGKELFASQGCVTCHSDDRRGGQSLDDGSGHQVFARDLTAPWTFRGGSRAEDIWLRLTTGIKPGPMPAYADVLAADARWDLANFVVSLARTPPWEKGGSFGGAGFAQDLNQRGNYLTRWEMCGLCHTQIDRTGIYNEDGAFLAGGTLRDGQAPDRLLSPFAMPWPLFHNLTDEDATAIATSLRQARGRCIILFRRNSAMGWLKP